MSKTSFDVGYNDTLKWIAEGSDATRIPGPDAKLTAEESADWWMGKQAAIDFANSEADSDEDQEAWEDWAMVAITIVLSLLPFWMLTSDHLWIRIASLPMFLVLWQVFRNVWRHIKRRR